MNLLIQMLRRSPTRRGRSLSAQLSKSVVASLTMGLSLALVAPSASALTFTKLLELGQKVPGNDQPVTDIYEPTIGLDGQIAVRLETQAVPITNGKKTFRGIYTIAKGGSLKFVEGGNTIVTEEGGIVALVDVDEFTAPSISNGKIAYLRYVAAFNGGQAIKPNSTTLRVGPPGNVKTVLTLPPAIIGSPQNPYSLSTLAYVNGKAYFLTQPSAPPDFFNFPITLNVVDTQVASPRLQTLNQNNFNTSVTASANTILLTQYTGSSLLFFESTGDANFKPITSLTSNCAGNESTGISTSHESIAAICGGSVLKVRFGRQGSFLTVPDPDGVVRPTRLGHPSLSDRSVLYTRYIAGVAPENNELYLSKNGQKPITLLKGGGRGRQGQQLDGKIVGLVKLSANGRTLAGNFAVCTVYFTDGSTVLYRIDL
jgi:hypothetical protein